MEPVSIQLQARPRGARPRWSACVGLIATAFVVLSSTLIPALVANAASGGLYITQATGPHGGVGNGGLRDIQPARGSVGHPCGDQRGRSEEHTSELQSR